MGMKRSSVRRPAPSGLADALFTSTQQRVLGLLFGQPDRSFYATEIIGLAARGSGAVQRELKRLEQSGLVKVTKLGTQKHFQANADSPLYAELSAIARKTFGLADPLRAALEPLAPKIKAAFVFGSVAKQRDSATSDIDVMIISDDVAYADLYEALQPVEQELGRPINPTVYGSEELHKRRNEGNAFVTRVLEQPKLWLIGSDDVLAA